MHSSIRIHLKTCEQEVLCFYESSDGRFARDGRKSLQKVFECFSTLEIVKERLDGHSGSAKHGSSTKNLRIFDGNSHEVIGSLCSGRRDNRATHQEQMY